MPGAYDDNDLKEMGFELINPNALVDDVVDENTLMTARCTICQPHRTIFFAPFEYFEEINEEKKKIVKDIFTAHQSEFHLNKK